MANVNCVHDSDLYMYPDYSKNKECKENGLYWGPPCPPLPPPPPDYPYPPFPPYWPPCPPCPPPAPEPEPDPKKNSIEAQICKLSKKAAALNRMIDNLENKKRDVIIKVGDTSFNFGNIDSEFEGWTDGSYAATVETILEHQRGLIQAEIKKLADELDDEAMESGSGIEGAISG